MKQHITTKDLEMLTDKAKQILAEWANKKGYQASDFSKGCQFTKNLSGNLVEIHWIPYLSIGQMIDFLTFTKPHGHLCYCTELKESAAHGWRVVVAGKTDKDTFVCSEVSELCDALWRACVDLLNSGS